MSEQPILGHAASYPAPARRTRCTYPYCECAGPIGFCPEQVGLKYDNDPPKRRKKRPQVVKWPHLDVDKRGQAKVGRRHKPHVVRIHPDGPTPKKTLEAVFRSIFPDVRFVTVRRKPVTKPKRVAKRGRRTVKTL